MARRKAGEGHRRVDGYLARGVGKSGRNQLDHILIAQRALGKPLPKGAQVHHANGDKTDNRNENLVICPDGAYHSLIHRRMRAKEACGNPSWLKCPYCKRYDDPANLYIRGRHNRHRECFNVAWNAMNQRKAAARRAAGDTGAAIQPTLDIGFSCT